MKRSDWWGGVLPFGFGLRSRLTALRQARRWPAALQAAPVMGMAPLLLLMAGKPRTLPPPDVVLDFTRGAGSAATTDLDYKDADVADVLRAFQFISGLQVRLEPAYEPRKITAKLIDVPWDEALQRLAQDSDARLVLRQGDIYWVPTSEVRPAGDDAGPRTTVFRTFPDARSAELAERVVTAALSSGGSVRRDPTSISLLIKDAPWRLDALALVLARLAATPAATAQVGEGTTSERASRKVGHVIHVGEEVTATMAGGQGQVPPLNAARYTFEVMVYRVPLGLARDLHVGPGGVTPWEVTARDVSGDELPSLRDLTSRPGVTLVSDSRSLAHEGEPVGIESVGPEGPESRTATAAMVAHREAGHLDLRWGVSIQDSDAHYDGNADSPVLLGFPLRNEPEMAGLALMVITPEGGHS